METQKEKQVRSLKRLIIAGSTFQDIMKACASLRNMDAHGPFASVYFVAITGIVVSYNRPFDNTSYGLGSIGKKYEEFPHNPEHARTHGDLINGRNVAFAHYSPIQAAQLLREEEEIAAHQKLEMTLNNEGDVEFKAHTLVWKTSNLKNIFDLCAFQSSRLLIESRELVNHLGASKVYPPGVYTIGATFP